MAQFNFIGKKIEILKGEGWNGNIEFIAPPINLYEGHYSYLFGTGATQEYRIKINDKVYGNEAFKDAINLQENLFDKSTFTVGSFTISVLKAKLMVPSEEIPHNASVVFSYRYNDGEIQSEWVERFKGKVTKRTKYTDEVTTIEAKDAASNYDVFLDYFGDSLDEYPANARQVATLCASHLGLKLDNINDIIDLDIVEYPNELTVVEVLRNIASNSGGNWAIVGDRLRLVTTGNETNQTYPAQSLETSGLLSPISKIMMYYADQSAFESGDDTGSTLEIDSKWATQESTNYVHSVLNGYEYKPIKVTNGYIDPALELGDIIFVDDNEVLLANVNWVFDGIVTATIDVPINNEVNYDDPYNKLVQAQFDRKVSLGDSYQGVTISRDKGLEMLVSPDGTEENALGRYYADLYRGIAFQTRDDKDQEWHDWMYFDLEEKTFKMHIIEEIQEEIDNIEKITTQNSAGIEGLSDTVKIHGQKITTTEKGIKDLDGNLTNLSKTVTEESGRLDVAYDKIESSVTKINQDLSESNSKITQLSGEVSTAVTKVDIVDNKIDNTTVKITPVEGVEIWNNNGKGLTIYDNQNQKSIELTSEGHIITREMTAVNANITGNLTAGNIAGLVFDDSKITFPNGKLTLDSGKNAITFGRMEMKHSTQSVGGVTGDIITISTPTGKIEFASGINYPGGSVPNTLKADSVATSSITHDTGRGNILIGGIEGVVPTEFTGEVLLNAPISPTTSSGVNMGTSSRRFNTLYLRNQPNVSSDMRYKHAIQDIPSDLIKEISKVEPKMYLQHDKWHFGYIAQDIERALEKWATNRYGSEARHYVDKFAFLHKDDNGYLSLLYGEIAVLKEKEMRDRIDSLEYELKEIKELLKKGR